MGNDFIDAARAYHEVTKHSYTSVRSSPHYLDWDIRPLPYKIYPGAAHIALPRDLSLSRIPALEAIAEVAPLSPRKALDVGALARILFCADGLTRRKSVGGEDYHFRAAPSAGALYPIELYAATAEVEGIEAGLYHFSPGDLRMAGLRRGDWREYIAHAAAGRPSILHARAVIVLTSIFWRSAWKYRARAFRYCFWDAGTILANLLAATYAEGLATEIVTAFADPTIEALLGIDGEREGTVAIVAIGETESPAGVSPDAPALALETIPLSSNEIVYDGITKIQRESRLLTPAEAAAVAHAEIEQAVELVEGNPFRFDPIPPHDAMGLGETILNRGSMRIFGQAPVPARELATIMAASSGHPRSDFSRLTDTYLIVNAIEEMEPGAYYYNRVARGFEALKTGNFRTEAGYLCLEQPLGRDCSALIVYMTNLEHALRALGNRGYRDAHLEAGILGGRGYLAAYALGLGATGLTFYDDDTTNFFSPHAIGKSPILMVAVGVAASAARRS